MDMNAARAFTEIMESLEDLECKQWLQQLLDLKARSALPDLVDMGLDVWCDSEEQTKDGLRLLFDSVSPPVPVPLVPLVANVVVLPSLSAKEDDEDDSTVALVHLCNVLGLVVLIVGLCFLFNPSVAPTTTNSDIEGLAVRVRMAENTARRASLGAAVCLRILRNQTLVKMDKQDTLLTRAALLALSPAVSKAWAYVPMRRVAHCNCTSRLEFAKYKTITDARLEALELKTREQAERALALETQAKDQKIRVDALADTFSTAALIWSLSAIGLAALVVTGAAPIVFAAQALAATTAGVGMALVEQNMV
jgi:hypothetical protein